MLVGQGPEVGLILKLREPELSAGMLLTTWESKAQAGTPNAMSALTQACTSQICRLCVRRARSSLTGGTCGHPKP